VGKTGKGLGFLQSIPKSKMTGTSLSNPFSVTGVLKLYVA